MIHKNALNFKLFQKNFSSKDLYDQFMASFKPELEVCPVCHSRGNCVKHAYYTRDLIDFVNGEVVCHRIRVMRVICRQCSKNATHAILPDLIIPFSTYGLIFILHVLKDLFSGKMTIEKICEKYDISPPAIYRWKKAFLAHKKLWLGVLDSASKAPADFLSELFCLRSYSENFAAPFVRTTTFSFLQTHMASYRRYVF